MYLNRNFFTLVFFMACAIVPRPLLASHIVGGGFVYKYLKDTTIAGVLHSKYEVSIYIYQDCISGVPDAIQQDDPAFFTLYRSDGMRVRVDTNIFYDRAPGSDGAIDVPVEMETACGKIYATAAINTCLRRKKFTKVYYLPVDNYNYTVAYQRCCRAPTIDNLQDPGDKGITIFCEIPAGATKNTSAVFGNHPPQVMCLNSSNISDQSATDADGDSLSYALDGMYEGASGPDIKPKIASAPPYKIVGYAAGYSLGNPLGSKGMVGIDEKTGVLTVTSYTKGVFQVGILCKEWRGGQVINTVRREVTWKAIECGNIAAYRPYAGGNRTVLVGDTLQFRGMNAATYRWEPATFLNNANIADPIGTFPTVGEYTYELHGETANGCSGKDVIKVIVKEHSEYTAPNAFTPNGDGRNDLLYPVAVGKVQFKEMKIYNRWGNVLFASGSAARGWDGTYNNKQQDNGVYVWIIEYTDSYGEPRVASGSTVLIR